MDWLSVILEGHIFDAEDEFLTLVLCDLMLNAYIFLLMN